MADVFVGDNDHGDAVPPTDVLLQMIKLLREDVVHFAQELDQLKHKESVRRQKILHDIGWFFEGGGAKDGSLNKLLYDLARREVEDMVIPNNSVTESYEKIATKYHTTFQKLAQEENTNG
jgi:hypothetical protein